MVLVQKWPFFQLLFLSNFDQENVFYDILERQNAFLRYKNKKSKKPNKWHFSKGVNPWFWSKNGHFSNFFFLRNLGQENVFNNILEIKNAFLRYKNKETKKSKNQHFSQEVNPWFWSKNGHFFKFFFLRNLGQKNVFNDILEKKTPFQAIKTRSRKSRKIDIFPKTLTHGFGPCKNGHFSNFSSQAIQTRKMSFTIFYNEKTPFYAIKTKSPKNQINGIFSKGLTHGFGRKMAIFLIFSF